MEEKKKIFKYKFALVTLGLLVFFVSLSAYYISKNLDNIVNYVLNTGLKYNIYIEKVDISKFGQIEARNVILREKNGDLVFEVPELEIQYNLKDIFRGKYVTSLWAKNPKVNLTIYEVKKLNIMNSLNLYEEKEEKDKPAPIQYIKVTGGILNYKDISYAKPVNLNLVELNGFVDMRNRMKLKFEAVDSKDSKQSFFFSQDEYEKKKYDFNFKMENVDLKDELLQYAWDDKETITYIDGKGNVDISFGDKGVSGQAFLKNATVKYALLKDNLTKVEASVNIDKENIDIFAKAKLQDYPVNLKLIKKGEKLGIYFDTKKISLPYIFENLPEQEIYKDINGVVDTLKGQLIFDNIHNPPPPVEIIATSKEVNYLTHKLQNAKLNFDFYSEKMKFDIKDLEFDYSNNDNPEYFVNMKSKLKGVYEEDKLNMTYSFKNSGSFFKNEKFNGEFVYDLKSSLFNLKNKDSIYTFDFSYNFNKEILKLKGNFKESIKFYTTKTKNTEFYGPLDLEYDFKKKLVLKAFGNIDFNNEILGQGDIVFSSYKEKVFINNLHLKRQNSYIVLNGEINSSTLEYQGEVLESNITSSEFPIIKTVEALKEMPDFYVNTKLKFNGKGKEFETNIDYIDFKTDYSKIIGNGKFNSLTQEYEGEILEASITSSEFPILKTVEGLKGMPNFQVNTSLKFRGKEKDLEADIDVLELSTEKSYLKAKGSINLKDLSYEGEILEASINTKELPMLQSYPEFNLKTSFKIKGVNRDFKLDYNAQIDSLDYGAKFNNINLYGLVEFKNGEIYGNTEGYIKEFAFSNFFFRDLFVALEFDKNRVIIEKVLNAYLLLNGIYNFEKDDLDLKYEIKDYDLEKVKASDYQIKGNISRVTGTIKDTVENPTVTANLEKSFINYNNTENAIIYGNLIMKNQLVFLENFFFKENKFTGEINLKEETLNLKANLLETNLNSYYKDNNVKYRVIGIVNIWGKYEDIRAVAQVNLDNIYYRGSKIPDLFLKLSYIDGSLSDFVNSGKLNLTELKILGDNGFNLMEADGYLDIASKEFDLKLGNDKIAIKDIEYLINEYKLKGNINLNLEAKGNLKGKIDYSLDLKSNQLTYNNILIDKVTARVKGDEKKLKVEYVEMTYGNNMLKAQGDFDIEKNIYDFTVKAKDVDLGLFNLFLSQRVRNINGKADIDIVLKTEESFGTIELKNSGLETLDKSMILSNTNSRIELNKDGVKINSFTGGLNNGTILLDGYLKIPKFTSDLFASPMDFLKDYSLSIKLDNVDYNYGKTVAINLDTDLNFSNNLLTGEILINRGNVFRLPTLAKQDSGEATVIPINANLEINIGDGIYFSADNIPLIEDIELKVEGGGILDIKNNKMNFIGKLISEDGALTFNNNIFSVGNAIIIFDGINEYFPNVNPSLAIKAQTKVQKEDIFITISGYYSNLTLDLQSSTGLNVQEITNLLLFKTNTGGSNVNTFVKDILDKQFSEEIFNPLSRELEKLLNISKVKISSKVLKLDEDSLSLSPDVLLGAEFEIGNSFYRDKYFWNLKTKFSNEKSGELAGFDAWVDYKLNNNLAWKLGVEKDNELIEIDKQNIYLGIDFKYQTDSIFKKK